MPLSKYDIEVDLEHRQGTSHAYIVEMVGSNKRVLDVGCDTGYLGEALATLGNRTIGIEISPISAEEARRRLEHVVVGDLETMDMVEVFGRGTFDVVIFGDVLEHLRDPLTVLRQSRHLLVPGGSVIVSLPNIAHGDIRLALLQGRFKYTNVGILDETHTKFFTYDTLIAFIHDAGFALVELRRTVAPLFSTETGVHEEDFPADLLQQLRNDQEATTYQFVARAVPEDASTATSAQALRLDTMAGEMSAVHRALTSAEAEADRFEAKAAELATECTQLRTQVAELTAVCDELREASSERGALAARLAGHEAGAREAAERARAAEQEAARARAELSALKATFTLRAARVPRLIYGRLRSR